MIFDVEGKNGFSSSSRLSASGCFVQPCKFIVFQIARSQEVPKEMPGSVQLRQLRKGSLESFFWSNGGRFSSAAMPRSKENKERSECSRGTSPEIQDVNAPEQGVPNVALVGPQLLWGRPVPHRVWQHPLCQWHSAVPPPHSPTEL